MLRFLLTEVQALNSELAYALDVARLADLHLNALLSRTPDPEITRQLIVAIETLTIHLRGAKRNDFETAIPSEVIETWILGTAPRKPPGTSLNQHRATIE